MTGGGNLLWYMVTGMMVYLVNGRLEDPFTGIRNADQTQSVGSEIRLFTLGKVKIRRTFELKAATEKVQEVPQTTSTIQTTTQQRKASFKPPASACLFFSYVVVCAKPHIRVLSISSVKFPGQRTTPNSHVTCRVLFVNSPFLQYRSSLCMTFTC